MRALFFVEPFPVRDSLTHFKDIARRFISLCAPGTGVDLRIFGNSDTLQLASEASDAEVQTRLLWPTEDEDALFQSQLLNWETDGIRLWSDYMAGGPASAPYAAVLERLRLEFPYDVILHWGENGAVSRFAADRGVTHIGIELGCSRKPFLNSYILDPLGTNGAAVVPRLSIDDIENIVDGRETSAGASILGCAQDDECAIYDSRFSQLPPELSSKLMQSGRKIAFLALQLFDDANLIQFAPYGDLRDVVLDVVPKLAAAGYLVVIKPHPASRYRKGAFQENAIARSAISSYSDDVVWFDDPESTVSNSRLMQVADLVVTVNSSVGFEALYFDKVVVVLGEAVYKPRGLFPSLDEAISQSFDLRKYLRNIGLLRTFFFDAYLVDEKWIADPLLFNHRVATLVGIQRSFPNDPFATAKAMFAAFAPAGQFLNSRRFAVGISGSKPDTFVAATPATKSPNATISARGFRDDADFEQMFAVIRRLSGVNDASAIKHWLRTQWSEDDARLSILRDIGAVDRDFYYEKYPPVKERGWDAVEHFCKMGEKRGFSPSSIIDRRAYSELPDPKYLHALLGLLDAADLESLPPSSTLTAEERDALQSADQELASLLERPPRSIAVVAHLYYVDLVDSLLEKLAQISDDFDLIVTLPLWGHKEISEKVKHRFGDAVCLPLPNRGRDVAPFLHTLPTLIRRGYSAVLKIQTKKGYYQAGRLKARLGTAWREYAWNCLAGSEAAIGEIVEAFKSNDALCMVGPAELLVRTQAYPVDIDFDTRRTIGIDQFSSDDVFFAGTMFWMRPSAFAAMATERFSFVQFSSDPENSDGELEHVAERLFGYLARRDGFQIAGMELDPGTGEARFNTAVSPNSRSLADAMEALVEVLDV